MFSNKQTFCFIFLILAILNSCEAGSIKLDIPQKCGIKDEKCQIQLFDTMFHQSAANGIPALGIPATDPFEIKDNTVSVLGMVDLTMVNGKMEGMTNCPFSKFKTDIENGVTNSEAFCEKVRIHGHYKIIPGPLVQALSGNGLSGEGNGAITIEKLTLKMKIPFKIEKQDGEIYIRPNYSEAEYSTDEVGKITFEADNVLLGNQESSQQVMSFMNNNWKIVNRTFGKTFSDKIMEVFWGYLNKFFQLIPANDYITDDLAPYVKS